MAIPLEEWLNTHVKEYSQYDIEMLSNLFFFREETRPAFIDRQYFFSPADGTILYQKIVYPDEKIIEIKGENYDLNHLLGSPSPVKEPCLVIGIFMSFYDVHVNRIPYRGVLKFKPIDSIKSYNMPMIFTEKGVFKNDRKYALHHAGYLMNNSRVLNSIYVPFLNYTYYLVQIADDDVDVITHFTMNQDDFFEQNSRFSFIRWGSQVDLVLPLRSDLEFKTLIPDFYHVQGVLDKLVHIKWS